MNETFSLKRVLKGASIYSAGEVLVKASGFLLIPIYTRILTPDDYGVIGYLAVFLSIITVIFAFGFNAAQTVYYYEKPEKSDFGKFAFTINIVPVVVAIIIFMPITFLSYIYNWTIGNAHIPFYPFMVVTLWTVILEVLANNALSYYKAQQRFGVTTILQVVRFFFITGATILLIVNYRMGALGKIKGHFIGLLLFLLISYAGYAKIFVWKFSRKALTYSVIFGAPIVIHGLASIIHEFIDRIILERFVSLESLGIYTLGFTIGTTMNIFLSSFNQAYQPGYYQLMSSDRTDKENQIIKTFKFWTIMTTVIASGGIIIGAPFLTIFAGKEFINTITIFPWIIFAMFLSGFYYFFSSPIFYFKKTKYLPLITGVSAIVNIVLNLILIPKHGIIGAAVATTFSHFISSVISYFVGNKIYKINWPLRWMFISISIVSVAMVVAFKINTHFLN